MTRPTFSGPLCDQPIWQNPPPFSSITINYNAEGTCTFSEGTMGYGGSATGTGTLVLTATEPGSTANGFYVTKTCCGVYTIVLTGAASWVVPVTVSYTCSPGGQAGTLPGFGAEIALVSGPGADQWTISTDANTGENDCGCDTPLEISQNSPILTTAQLIGSHMLSQDNNAVVGDVTYTGTTSVTVIIS